MTNRRLTCIECPKGCSLSVDIEGCKVVNVTGHLCPKGKVYAASEVENPMRILTASVLAAGLEMKMVPVRTDKPIPKSKLMEAMADIKRIKVNRPLQIGDVIIENFLGLGINLVSTRELR